MFGPDPRLPLLNLTEVILGKNTDISQGYLEHISFCQTPATQSLKCFTEYTVCVAMVFKSNNLKTIIC